MKFLVLALTLISFNAFATEVVVLECTTPGDALDAVQLIEKGNKSILRILTLAETKHDYVLNRNLKNIKKGAADTLIGTSKKSIEFGGAVSDAVMIRVFPGQREARMAANGTVYFLNCLR